jgi:chromosome segregation ATPase
MPDWTWLEDAKIPEDDDEHDELRGKITELNQQLNYVQQTLEGYRRKHADPEWQERQAEYLEQQLDEAAATVEIHCQHCGDEHPDDRFCVGVLGTEWAPDPADLAHRTRVVSDREAQIKRSFSIMIAVNQQKAEQLTRQMNALGARQMRPYEHFNEEEGYREYLDTRYENFDEDR